MPAQRLRVAPEAKASWIRTAPSSPRSSRRTATSRCLNLRLPCVTRPTYVRTRTRLESFFASSDTRTKKPLVAAERRRTNVRRKRVDWFRHRIPAVSAQPERVVFIDETSVKTNLTRLRGWAPCGDRLVMDAPFGSCGTQTFIAGLTADAMIAPWVIKGAMDGPAFAACVEKVLVPERAPGTAVILDNLATHKNSAAAKAMRDAGCWFLFLQPYSPDLNPIEMAFSKLKAHLRRIGARTFTDMFDAIAQVCDLYSPQECWNYFKTAGYVSS